VMTVKRLSLLSLGVCKQEYDTSKEFLKADNLDTDILEKLVRTVATHKKLPETVPFSVTNRGQNDVAIFDFSKRKQCTELVKFVTFEGTPDRLPIFLIGDSLIEPFWPLGTGANRAFLSAMDSAWVLKNYFSPNPLPEDKLKEKLASFFKILVVSLQDDLHKNHSLHGLDPASRYNSRTHDKYH